MKQSRLLVGEVKSFSSLSFLKIFFVKASLWSTVINNKVIFLFFLPTEAAHLQRTSEYTALCIIFTFLSRHWHFSAIHIQSPVKGVIFLMWCQKNYIYYIHWSPTNHLKKKNISGERRKKERWHIKADRQTKKNSKIILNLETVPARYCICNIVQL